MTIKLYKNLSAPNYVDKSLTLVDTLEGNLRSPSSIIDPTFTIERELPTGFNYVEIPSFNRYYFVTGVSTDGRNLVSIACHVDVLMTFKNEIRGSTAVVKRQENKFNLYLDDGIFKAYQNTKHKIIRLPYGFTDYSYILALAGNALSE